MADKLKRIAALLLCLVLLSGCAGGSSTDYEVLGQLSSPDSSPEYEFDFSATLRLLYPESESVVIAFIKNVDVDSCTAVPVRVLEGDSIKEDAEFTLKLPEDALPEEGSAYFLFLSEEDGEYTALTDSNGLIKLDDETLVSESGATLSLTQALSELDKMQNFIYIPSYFYYQSELESLVEGCSLICIGTIESIEELSEVKFYVREPGLEEITSLPATSIVISVEECLMGESNGSASIVLSDAMYKNTVIDSSFEQPVYSQDSLPELQIGSRYLFFLMESPAGKHGAYKLFVNPYQGYVPLYNDDTLIAIPINAPFSYTQDLEDVRMDIEDIVSRYQSSDTDSSDQSDTASELPPADEGSTTNP